MLSGIKHCWVLELKSYPWYTALLCLSQLTLLLGKYAFLCGKTIASKYRLLYFPVNNHNGKKMSRLEYHWLLLLRLLSLPRARKFWSTVRKWFLSRKMVVLQSEKSMRGCWWAALQVLNQDLTCKTRQV